MSIKLADTLAPLADFPAAYAKDIEFDDGKNLQEKLNNGELGGGGTSITVDTAMSSTSTNPVQNKVIKAYVDGKSVDISADSNNAIQTKTDGIYVEKTKISTDDGNALSKKSDGLFVEDLSNKVNALNIAQKTVNSELEYYYATKTTSISGVSIKDSNLINYLYYLTNITSNLEPSRYNTKGVTLKKSKTYRITFGLTRATTSGNGASAYVMDSDGNKLGNRGYFGSNSYSDNIIDVIYTPTKDISVYPALVNLNTNLESTYYPDCSFFQITEIGREVIIDPVEYVDSTKGIEDTPVGEIIRTIGNKTPKHYLMCDGSTHNIADYPYLAQYFKDTFGAINVFGGDGTTTFGVPDYTTEKKLNTQYMAPNAWASSVYSSNYEASKAFNGTLNTMSNYWQTVENITLPVEIGIDLGSEYYITRYALHNLGWNTIAINDRPNTWDFEGSNDKINWNTIDTVTNYTWTNNTPEFKVSIPGSYRYYRLIIKTCVGTGVSGVAVAPILNQILLYYSNSNFTHIKAEPTYYMQNTFNTNSVYSTDEMIIGRWIDGKPLYRKVIQTIISDGGIVLSDANCILVRYEWYAPSNGIKLLKLPSPNTGNAALWQLDNGNIVFNIPGSSDMNGKLATCILEYTKTTD